MLMFDSLNRRMLEPYGCDWVKTPNFKRLAEKTVTFTNSYAGSLPCMPARRELHTGRYNFLHRSWGPIEPFDDSMPDLLKNNGIYSRLVSDHYHYWEDGGCTYHTRYSTWDFPRGQEGDPWIGQVADPEIPPVENKKRLSSKPFIQDWINRPYMAEEKNHPQVKTFKAGKEFIELNKDEDNWFLHLETFDPHEPYFSPQRFKDMYPHKYDGKHFDWPPYGPADQPQEIIDHCRYESAALHTMCDENLGKVLDMMDKYNMWEDTMLIVNTDHGFLLGEHDYWAKCWCPFYNEVANTPLFVWDPRTGKKGEMRDSLVQTIDLPATVLDFFNIEKPEDMQGIALKDTVENDAPVREAALFGIHGGHINVTDGKYVYMRAPISQDNSPLYNYTHMPTHMKNMFAVEELQGKIDLAEPFDFTKGCKTMKIDCTHTKQQAHKYGTLLFDVESDPKQENTRDLPEVESQMIKHMIRLMKENDAPEEQYIRMGLTEYL
jgi:arylsulfatase A-like enzyme